MANYNEQSGTGQSWQRCYTVTIDNPYQGTPVITFHEELVVQMGDNTIRQPKTSCRVTFNPTTEFDVVNPVNGIATGAKITHKDLYVYLHSLYLDTAKKRDNENLGIAVNVPNQ
jgi:hypothetical protein